jgi:hypothetical protein
MEVRPIREKYNFFQSESEAIAGLESSVAALRYLSDSLLPEEHREEAIGRVIAGIGMD